MRHLHQRAAASAERRLAFDFQPTLDRSCEARVDEGASEGTTSLPKQGRSSAEGRPFSFHCYDLVVIKGLTAATILVGILRGPGCGEVDRPENGANAPCTRDKDCQSSLLCEEGVCVPPSPPDADAAAGSDG
jgi:hypothetical protein